LCFVFLSVHLTRKKGKGGKSTVGKRGGKEEKSSL